MFARIALILLASLTCVGLFAIAQEPTGLTAEEARQGRPITPPPGGEESLDAPAPDGVRPGGTLARELEPPYIPQEVTAMRRPVRNYPEQPPVVPHTTRGYQVDKNFNRCLSCHSRSATETSGAPMVSVTHFVDREGQVLAAVSPRRYFCLKCHVPQHQVEPIRDNTFKSIDQVLQEVIVERESQKETWRSRSE